MLITALQMHSIAPHIPARQAAIDPKGDDGHAGQQRASWVTAEVVAEHV